MSATSQPAAALAPEQALGTFVGHVCRYFETVGGSRPQMLEPSLELRPSSRLDKTGYMAISGVAEGETEPMTLAWPFPSNAFLPVAIS